MLMLFLALSTICSLQAKEISWADANEPTAGLCHIWTELQVEQASDRVMPGPIVFNPVIIHNDCYGDTLASITLNPSGGELPYKRYSWSHLPGNNNPQNVINLAAGSYTITIRDDDNVNFDTTIVILEPTELTTAMNGSNVMINGAADGQADVIASGGTAPYSYAWTGGSTNDTLFNATAQKYYVTVTDFNGCTKLDSITLTEPTELVLAMNQSDITCNGVADGQADVAATGGVAPYTYAWSDASTNDTLFNAIAQKYYITVTDFNGATQLDSATIAEPTVLATAMNGSDVTVFAGADGQADVAVTGGIAPYTYAWTGGSINDTLFNATAQKYYVTVTDFNGCTKLDSITLTEPAELVLTMNQSNATTNGAANGQADVAVSGGVTPYTFLWTGGSTNDTLFAATAQKYYITVTDFNGAVKMDSVTITEPAILETAMSGDNISAYGATDGQADVVATGGTAPYTYLWTGGNTNDTLFNAIAQKYYVTVTDFLGGTKLDSITLTQPAPAPLVLTMSQNDIACNAAANGQADVAVSGGVAPYTFSWTGGSANDTLFNATAQKYYITVTDFIGTSELDSVTITEPAALTAVVSGNDVTIFGSNNGQADVAVTGGVAPYSYVWTGASTNDTVFNAIAQKYYVTVTDFNGCTKLDSITLTEPAELVLTMNQSNATANGAANGQADVAVSGGVAPYSFLWTGGSTNDTLFAATAQKYYITVTDFNGAVKMDSVTITEPAILETVMSGNDISIFGGADGQADVTATGGTAPYTYLWTGGSINDTLFNATAQKYYVTVTDFLGGTKLDSITLTEPTELVLAMNQTDVSCNGLANGQADVEATGGVAPYTYAWTGGSANDTLFNASAQKHYITVSDFNGASKLDSVTIAEPAILTTVMSGTDVSVFGGSDGQADVAVSGGTAPYTYSWTGGSINDTLFNITAQKYYVTATDFNGCTKLDSITIAEPAELLIVTDTDSLTCSNFRRWKCVGNPQQVV